MKRTNRTCFIIGDSVCIPLDDKTFSFADIQFFSIVNSYSWHMKVDRGRDVAVYTKIKRKSTKLHHIVIGKPPPGFIVDHIDGNVRNNRLENLRFGTNQQNQMNQRCSKNKFKGVFWSKPAKKWQSTIRFDKKTIYLGLFEIQEEAARAYDKKALELFGEFACTNEMLGRL